MKFHVHAGCVEVTLCLSGKIVFELPQNEVHVFPDEVFATQPAQPHHMVAHPKGMCIYGFLFRLPRKVEPVLGLEKGESKWLCDRPECSARRDDKPLFRCRKPRFSAAMKNHG